MISAEPLTVGRGTNINEAFEANPVPSQITHVRVYQS
jgi:hypothetical protein